MPPTIGLPSGSQEHRQRPAAAPADDAKRGHVDVIDVGPFLAIHLDANEVLVQDLGHFLVGERFLLHDVAPVTGAVADGQENELFLFLGLLERLRPPGIPVDRVVGVLQEIGAAFLGKPVGLPAFFFFGRRFSARRDCGTKEQHAARGTGPTNRLAQDWPSLVSVWVVRAWSVHARQFLIPILSGLEVLLPSEKTLAFISVACQYICYERIEADNMGEPIMRLHRWLGMFLGVFLLVGTSTTRGDDKSDLLAKQKKIVQENLKKMQVEKPAIIETDGLFVTGLLPEEKLKPIAAMAQKYYAFTYKALKFQMGDSTPRGKYALYVFPERAKYTAFFRGLERNVERDEQRFSEPRAEVPYIAVTVALGDTKGNIEGEAGAAIAGALLVNKGGPAAIPRWMSLGFSKAIQMRLEPTVFARDRSEMRRLVLATTKKPAKDGKWYSLKDTWSEDETPDRKLLSASLMDYLVFGPESAKFGKLIIGFRISDDVPNPTINSAMKAAEFTPEALEKAWKKWIASGK